MKTKLFTLFVTLLFASTAIAATSMTCTQAASAALSVSASGVLYNNGATYTVRGYVTYVYAYESSYRRMSFWISDAPNGGKVLEAYRCSINNEADAPNCGDLVEVTGQLTKYIGGDDTIPEFTSGCTCTVITRDDGSTPFSGATVQIGDLFYNLDGVAQTAEVTYQAIIIHNYDNLTSVSLPSSVSYLGTTYLVTSIGETAFYWCDDLTSINIPNSVTSIGKMAFRYCRSLTYVTLPNSITSIGRMAFDQCENLTSIIVPCGELVRFQQMYSDSRFQYIPSPYIINVNQTSNGYVRIPSYSSCDDSIQVGAWPYQNYHFVRWTDGNIDNPRTIYLTQNVTVEAIFARNPIITYVYNSEQGCVSGPTTTPTGIAADSITFEAVPNNNYHFVRWTDGNTDNPRTIYLTQDMTVEAVFAYNPVITYKYNSDMGYVIGDTITPTGVAISELTFEAVPRRGCYFNRWADGNTDNPRTIELRQDTTMEAIFDYQLSGKCGKDSVLTWTLDTAILSLNITGQGALSENYTYGLFIESLIIGNEITQIGEDAFSYFEQLKNVILGSSVKVLESYAFYYCSSIESITCYSQRPPTVNEGALYGLDYSTIVYVPVEYLETYKMHDVWGLYDVRPLETAIEVIEGENIKPTKKLFNDGQVLILRGEKVYTLEGQEVR